MNQKSKTLKKSILFIAIPLVVVVGCKSGEDKSKTDKDKAAQSGENASPSGLTPEQAALAVAKVGDQTLTVGDITEQINKLSPYIRRRWAAPEKRKEFLDNLIRVELLSQEAKRLGLGDNNPEVERVVDQVMIRLMIKNDLEKDLIPTSIDEEILKQEYEKEKEKYLRPAQIRASHIVLKTKADAEKILVDLKAHASDSRYFRDMAAKHSLDTATKDAGGDLGYFSETGEKSADEPKVDQATARAAWKIEKIGDLTPAPVEIAAGFDIIRLTNKRAKLERTFDSVKRMIESRLLRDKRKEALDKFVSDLKTKAKVEIFEDNLAKLKIPQDPMQPSMGGGVHPLPSEKKGGVPSHALGPQPTPKSYSTAALPKAEE